MDGSCVRSLLAPGAGLPIVTIFFIWAISDHPGPAEVVLRLAPGTPGWNRAFLGLLFGSTTVVLLGARFLRGLPPD
jgi:hypothetical protein